MAQSKHLGAVIEEELECGICLERLKSPRLLTCLHSFCEECLQRCVNDDHTERSLLCPACRDITVIQKSGVSGLRPDFRANKLLRALEEEERRKEKFGSTQQKCSLCDAAEALMFCADCEQVMCQCCCDFHFKMPALRNHKASPLDEAMNTTMDTGKDTSTSMCQRHREQLKFYCKTCNTPICADCTVLDHNNAGGHECIYLTDIIAKLRAELESWSLKVQAKQRHMEEFSSDITKGKEEFEMHFASVTRNIENEVENIKQILLTRNSAIEKRCLENLLHIQQKNESALKTVRNIANVVQKVTTTKDDIEVAEMFQSVHESVESIADETENLVDFKTLKVHVNTLNVKTDKNDSCIHPLIKLVQQKRSMTPQLIPNVKEVLAVSSGENEQIMVFFEQQNGQLCHRMLNEIRCGSSTNQRSGGFSFGSSTNQRSGGFSFGARQITRATTTTGITLGGYSQQGAGLFGKQGPSHQEFQFPVRSTVKGRKRSCAVLPNGQQCYLSGEYLIEGARRHHLKAICEHFGIQCASRPNEENANVSTDFVGNIYLTLANFNFVLVLGQDGSKFSIPTGKITPTRVAGCRDSHENILVVHQPAKVSKIDRHGNVFCTISDHGDNVWEKAAVASKTDGKIYVLSGKAAKCTLRVFTKQGELVETIFKDRPEKSPNQQPLGNQETGHPLSIAVASDGTIAAALGGPEVIIITTEEVEAL